MAKIIIMEENLFTIQANCYAYLYNSNYKDAGDITTYYA